MALREGQWTANATVVDAVMGFTGTGKEQLAVTFELDPTEQETGAGGPRGRTRLTKYLFFTEKALPMALNALEALGWRPEEHDWDLYGLVEQKLLIGREARLVLEVRTDDYGTRTEIVFVNSMGGAVKERMAPEAAQAFSHSLRERLMAARAAQDPAAVRDRSQAGGARSQAAARPPAVAAKPQPKGTPPKAAAPAKGGQAPGPQVARSGNSPPGEELNTEDIPF